MTYTFWTTSRPGYSPQATHPYVVPLRNGIFNDSLKKPISVDARWAGYNQVTSYDLRARDEQKEPNAAQYFYKRTYEKERRDTRYVKDNQGPEHLGFMTSPYGPNQIHDVAVEVSFKHKYRGDFGDSGFHLPARRSDRRLSRQEEILAISRSIGPKPELSPTFCRTQHRSRSGSRGGGFGDQRGGYEVDCYRRVGYGRWDGVQFNDGFDERERWEKETYRKTSKMR